jgi:hypothetical protein
MNFVLPFGYLSHQSTILNAFVAICSSSTFLIVTFSIMTEQIVDLRRVRNIKLTAYWMALLTICRA